MHDRRPKVQPPPGACDCHMHFYGPEDRYPAAPTAALVPPPATVDDYRQVQARLGLERVVVVQPTTYGTDNRCTMDAVTELGEAARAVVVVDPSVSFAELEQLTKDGARGIRFHMFKGGVLPWSILEEMAARVHSFGWHVQLQCNGRELPEREALLRRLPGTLVIDHIGRFQDPVPPDHPAFRSLLGLLETGRLWIKLSAPYESSRSGPARLPGRERARPRADQGRPRSHALGDQLAASRPDRSRGARRRAGARSVGRAGRPTRRPAIAS